MTQSSTHKPSELVQFEGKQVSVKSKKVRQAVFNKFGGHCAYCGKQLSSTSEMQIDHVYSKLYSRFHHQAVNNSFENLMPSCRQCNYYKSASTLEGFRRNLMKTLSHTCRTPFTVRLAMQYGMLTYHQWDGKFYFERLLEQQAQSEDSPKPSIREV